jgi:transcriptional regulator with XRE-family HTH domain
MDRSLEERVSQALRSEEAEIEKAKLEFTEELLAIMEQKSISRSDLAASLNVKPSRVTSLLRGLNNFTLATIIRLCRAVGAQYRHHIQPEGFVTMWTDWPVIGSRRKPLIAQPSLIGQRIELFREGEAMSVVSLKDDTSSVNEHLGQHLALAA